MRWIKALLVDLAGVGIGLLVSLCTHKLDWIFDYYIQLGRHITK